MSASIVEIARSDPAALELRGASSSVTVNAPPLARRAAVGAAASAVPLGP